MYEKFFVNGGSFRIYLSEESVGKNETNNPLKFEDAPMLYAVIPTTWVLNGVKFAGYVIPVGVAIAAISACLLFKAVKRV